jgi:hypothetical protein
MSLADRFPPSEPGKGNLAGHLMQEANRQLTAENQALKHAAQTRSADTCVQTIEGLAVLIEETGRGNKQARQMLQLLVDRLEQARTILAGLVIAGN